MPKLTIEKLRNFCKAKGFAYPGSEIYGGTANTWDYGPLGVELKNNIKNEWWKYFVQENHQNVGLDPGILMHPKVWEASNTVSNFGDLMFKVKDIGSEGITSYLRTGLGQSGFINFFNVQESMNLQIPFGIGLIGKTFRNEYNSRQFIFRTVEFEQLNMHRLCDEKDAMTEYEDHAKQAMDFLVGRLGFDAKNLRFENTDRLPHYAKKNVDIDYDFCFGWGEICSVGHRGDYDLVLHNMKPKAPTANIVTISHGADRVLLALLDNCYHEEQGRVVLKLLPQLAPYKVAVLPLQKNAHADKAYEIYKMLSKYFMATYDEKGSLGKRYQRQDEIGTPLCVTVSNDKITIRYRDTMEEKGVSKSNLIHLVSEVLWGGRKESNFPD